MGNQESVDICTCHANNLYKVHNTLLFSEIGDDDECDSVKLTQPRGDIEIIMEESDDESEEEPEETLF